MLFSNDLVGTFDTNNNNGTSTSESACLEHLHSHTDFGFYSTYIIDTRCR